MYNSIPKRAIIFTGGALGDWTLSMIQPDDYLIGADRGAAFLIHHGFTPDLVLGDFDSVTAVQMNQIKENAKEILTFDAIDKDWTDTELAVREAMTRGFTSLLLLGALGTRFDHSMGNVHLLVLAYESGCELVLMDEHNEIILCAEQCRVLANTQYPYLSLLPLTAEVTGVTLIGFRYPLDHATIKLGQTIGISNVLVAEAGSIMITSGLLLVIRSRD